MIRTLGSVSALALGLLVLDGWGVLSLAPWPSAHASKAQRAAVHSARIANRRQTVSQPKVSRPIARRTPTNRGPRVAGPPRHFGGLVSHTQKSGGTTFHPKVIRNQTPPGTTKTGAGTTGPGTGTGPVTSNPIGKGAGATGAPPTPKSGKLGHGPGKAVAFHPPKGPVIKLSIGVFPIVAGPKRIFRDGHWHSFVPFTTLGVLAVSGAYFYPSAYVSAGRQACTGLTPDGCHLNWQLIGMDGGGSAYQCVTYCPRPGQNAPPPASMLVKMAPPPPPLADGGCELTAYAEPNFGGESQEATGDQANLSESGWKDQISSLKIKSGVWDFFTDDGFGGESMRLHPGAQPDLGPEWSKHIGSFQCIQGGR